MVFSFIIKRVILKKLVKLKTLFMRSKVLLKSSMVTVFCLQKINMFVVIIANQGTRASSFYLK